MFRGNRYAAVSLNYFLFYACIGSFLPFVSLYLKGAGWSGVAIGMYAAIGPLVTFLTQPLWGFVGDLWGNLRLLFALLILITGASIGLFASVPVSPTFYVLAFLVGLFQGPLSPMLDSMSVRILGDEKNNWGLTRLWGSIGFAAISLVVGRLFARNTTFLFVGYGIGAVCTALAIFALPPITQNTKGKTQGESFKLADLGTVFRGPFLTFLGAMFIVQLGQYLPANFLSIVITDRGASSTLVGLVWSVTALVEIPVFIGTGRLLRKQAPEHLLIWAGLFNAGRLVLFAVAFHPLFMLLAQALEGLAFATILVSLVLIVDRLIPPEFHATGFTLYVACTITLPQLLGGLVGGRIYDSWGGTVLYFISALITLVGVAAFTLWHRANARASEDLNEN